MNKLLPVSKRILIKKLKSFGFEGPFSGGKHQYMIKENIVLTLPNPHKDLIGVDLLQRILSQTGIDRNEWLKE